MQTYFDKPLKPSVQVKLFPIKIQYSKWGAYASVFYNCTSNKIFSIAPFGAHRKHNNKCMCVCYQIRGMQPIN